MMQMPLFATTPPGDAFCRCGILLCDGEGPVCSCCQFYAREPK